MSDALAQLRRKRLQKLTEASVSVNSVCKTAGIREGTLRAYLKGTTRELSIPKWERLAAALEVDPAWLVFGVVAVSEEDQRFLELARTADAGDLLRLADGMKRLKKRPAA